MLERTCIWAASHVNGDMAALHTQHTHAHTHNTHAATPAKLHGEWHFSVAIFILRTLRKCERNIVNVLHAQHSSGSMRVCVCACVCVGALYSHTMGSWQVMMIKHCNEIANWHRAMPNFVRGCVSLAVALSLYVCL